MTPLQFAKKEKLLVLLGLLITVLFLGDIFTTAFIIDNGGKEYNPLMDLFVREITLHITAKLLALTAVFLVVILSVRWIRKTNKDIPAYINNIDCTKMAMLSIVLMYLIVNGFNLSNIISFL